MAQKAIYEYDAKNLIGRCLENYTSRIWNYDRSLLITPRSHLLDLESEYTWIPSSNLVVKPDVLIGKRGKSGLVEMDIGLDEALDYIERNMGKEVSIGHNKGKLDRFIIEPFIPHEKEYYISIDSNRTHDIITFSERGGMSIEDQWHETQSVEIPVDNMIDDDLSRLFSDSSEDVNEIADFLRNLYRVYVNQDFCFLEINPFTVIDNLVIPLDMKAKLDDTAYFLHRDTWGNPEEPISFPAGFGQTISEEERFIQHLDMMTGASLKFTLLNEMGRIWTIIAGGGASVIYVDTIVDLGAEEELANYGEYSGNPTKEHIELYTKTIIDLMCRHPKDSDKGRILLIGGGIANFTDVHETFEGVARALRQNVSRLREYNTRIYVRRGGPNEKEGLQMMDSLGKELDIPIQVYDRYTPMTRIVQIALEE